MIQEEGMGSVVNSEPVLELLGSILLIVVGLAIGGGLIRLLYSILTLPLRRAERARRLLELIESAINQGRPVEETLISVSYSNDRSLGVRFHLFASWLEKGLRLSDALAKVPRFLPRQVAAILLAGQKIGDLRKVLPACRHLLQDAVSQTRGAISYLVILTFVITPFGLVVLGCLQVMVVPKFREISTGMMGGDVAGIDFVFNHAAAFLTIQICLLVLLWLAAFLYMGMPSSPFWHPVLDRLHFCLPWRRKRLQRDFSTLLALLLDAGVPEPEAVALAADGTANTVFRRRAARSVERLQQGATLTQAVQSMDDSGEFAWRLANAVHGRTGFMQALAGWHESLDAKAFQQEQAAAHGITSALVLWSGLFVGAVAISAFMFLTSLTNSAVLW
jgi:type II secretory pathway component PulF